MVAADHAPSYARKLGIQRDQVVQEWGWDEDTDDEIRAAVEDACGGELLDEDTDEVIDVVLLWWRDGDGDLVDTLMDAIAPLAEDGVIWVLTPKTGRPGHVLPAEIAESAPTAGLMPTSSVNLGDWSASQVGAAEVADREALMLPVGTTAPDFTLHDQNRQPVSLSTYRGAKNVLLVFFPLAFTGICQGELDQLRDHLPEFENDDTATLAISVGPPPTHKIWALESGFTFPVLSDFWPHGEVARPMACSTTTPATPIAAPSSSIGPGIIRFAEMKGPGEARDQRLWTDALAA